MSAQTSKNKIRPGLVDDLHKIGEHDDPALSK